MGLLCLLPINGCLAPVIEFVIERPEKYGGTVRFTTYEQLEQAYAKEEIYPLDLKNGVATHLNNVSHSGCLMMVA